MATETNKGILIVSFGTLHQETCERTIDAIEDDLAKAFPERKAYSAWTSEFIIRKLREKQGIHRDTVSEALERMKKDGITDLLVQPTHLIDGFENQRLEGLLLENADSFESIKMGRPILDSAEDMQSLSLVIARDIYSANAADSKTALLLMGHGSTGDESANSAYKKLQECFDNMGLPEIVVGTVEGKPSLEDALTRLQAFDSFNRNLQESAPVPEGTNDSSDRVTKAIITPLMIVAGNHAVKDMDGDQEDSWKNILRSKGFEVTTLIKGLGEYWSIRNMLIVHAVSAKTLNS